MARQSTTTRMLHINFVMFCENYFGGAVYAEFMNSNLQSSDILQSRLPSMVCFAIRPGVCESRHTKQRDAVFAFFKVTPKKST